MGMTEQTVDILVLTSDSKDVVNFKRETEREKERVQYHVIEEIQNIILSQ